MMVKVERMFNIVPTNTQRRTKRDRWSLKSCVKRKARTRACSCSIDGTEGVENGCHTKQLSELRCAGENGR